MSVGGFIQPNNRVDVLLTLRVPDDQLEKGEPQPGGALTATLLQNVEILAVGDVINPLDQEGRENQKTRLRTVTLSVTPDQAARLHLGSTQGILHLSLRNPEDQEDAHPKVATLNEIRGMTMAANKPTGEDLLMSRMEMLLKQLEDEQLAQRKQLENRVRELEKGRDGEPGNG